MSDNEADQFRRQFDELRMAAHGAPLAQPADIRRIGTHRNHVRRVVLTLSVVLVLLVGGLAAYGSGALDAAPTGDAPTTIGATSSTATPSRPPSASPTAAGPSNSSGTVSSSLPPRQAGADCRPDDLDPRPYYGSEGAAGTAYSAVTVQNVSATRCRLYGHPTVLFTDPGTGVTKTMPITRTGDAVPVMLQPGGWATLTFIRANGLLFPSGSPQCEHRRSYEGLSVIIGDDLAYRLRSFDLSWECGDVTIGPWSPAPNGPPPAPQMTRPAP